LKQRKTFANLHRNIFLLCFAALSLFVMAFTSLPLSAQILADSAKPLPDIVFFVEASGFIPFRESYRINYETSLAGLPIEGAAGLCFPLNESLSGMFAFRYKRRTAIFVPDFRIKTLEVELGARDFLEKEHEKDLRLFGSAGLLLCRSTAEGNIESTSDGKNISTMEVSQDYFNIGLALGLGIEYPLTKISGLYLGIHLGIYFSNEIATGGLGNIGGLSIGLGYRIGFGN
jgi:hypothetical protein